MMHILVLCTGNSARSILLGSILRRGCTKVYALLFAKAEALLALPFEEMTQEDRQAIFNRIGG